MKASNVLFHFAYNHNLLEFEKHKQRICVRTVKNKYFQAHVTISEVSFVIRVCDNLY